MGETAEQLSIDESIDARLQAEDAVTAGSGLAAGALPTAGCDGLGVNPLRDEPHPTVIRAVQRFGLVGLVGCAVGAACLRWWRSSGH